MSTMSPMEWVSRIRDAAHEARAAETMANAVAGLDTGLEFWRQFDAAMATVTGLILAPQGVAALDAIEALIGGQP